jgi:SOS-response transcriptional repressor LexA
MSAVDHFKRMREVRRGGFVALHRQGLKLVRRLIAEGRLRYIDQYVLTVLAENANVRTGLSQTSIAYLAEIEGMPSRTSIGYSLRRLETAGLIRRVSRSRRSQALLVVSPFVFTGASDERIERHHVAWLREQDAVPPPPVTANAVRVGHAIAPAA